MIDNPVLDNDFGEDGLALTTESLKYLDETAKWAKFLAIVGFVMLGIMAIGAVFIGIYTPTMFPSELSELPEEATAGLTKSILLFYLMMLIIYFLPTLYLYRFATQTRLAISMFNSTGLTEGLKNLSRTFKFIGILAIIILGMYAFIFIIMGLVFVFAGM